MLTFKVALNFLELGLRNYDGPVPCPHGKFKSLQISFRRGFDGRCGGQSYEHIHLQMGPSENMGSFHGHIWLPEAINPHLVAYIPKISEVSYWNPLTQDNPL
jgi:hypothetical protein